ncbi:GNAT family N-acetyltransferase [Rhizobium sp. RCAM05350]|nr:GNAT family N-acetyltransferase [Rhizobium sp. RCAM05350]
MPANIDDDLVTRTGFGFRVRRATPNDEDIVAEFFKHVTPEDMRFRFLSSMKTLSHERILEMTRSDDPFVVNFLALASDKTVVAVTTLAGEDPDRGEVAVTIRDDYKLRGIGWEMLAHMCRYAEQRGFKSVRSLESHENHAAINLEREMKFKAYDDEDDPSVVILRRNLGSDPPSAPS